MSHALLRGGSLRAAAGQAKGSSAFQRPAPFLSGHSRSISVAAMGRRAISSHVMRAAAPAEAAPAPAAPQEKLSSIQMASIINTQGFVQPDVPEGTEASVFAVYDDKQKLQYIGFSKDLRSTLRTVLGRRPDRAFFYKAQHFSSADQKAMVALRDAWFEECGGQPPGNKLALERAAWQQPVDGGAISQRGKAAAAEEKARQLVEMIKNRGCKEDFVPNPTLVLEGKVDFLAARSLSGEELAAIAAAQAAAAAKTRRATALVDGVAVEFTVQYKMRLKTNGGHMVDVSMTHDGSETSHRIIVGKQYYEPYGLTPDAAVEACLCMLLARKLDRHTEGILESSKFPSNYFSVSEMEQWFGDDFRAEFLRSTGNEMTAEDTAFWRFNKIHNYGPLRGGQPGALPPGSVQYD